MSDITERLRKWDGYDTHEVALRDEAAAEIERLRIAIAEGSRIATQLREGLDARERLLGEIREAMGIDARAEDAQRLMVEAASRVPYAEDIKRFADGMADAPGLYTLETCIAAYRKFLKAHGRTTNHNAGAQVLAENEIGQTPYVLSEVEQKVMHGALMRSVKAIEPENQVGPQRLVSPVARDAFGRPYIAAFQRLCQEIERLPAGEQQTKVSEMANALHRTLAESGAAICDSQTDLLNALGDSCRAICPEKETP